MLKQIARQFAKPEGFGGRLSTCTMNIMNQIFYRCVFNQRCKAKMYKILDIGYGNGYLLKKFLNHGYKDVTGIEISETMQEKVQKNLASKIALKECSLSLCKVENMPFDKNTFDYMYSVNTIYFWESLDIALQEIYRVGKGNSICVLAQYDTGFLTKISFDKYGFHFYESKEIEDALKRNGFVIEEIILKRFHTVKCYVCKIIKE